jgi:hypothetical protein
VVDLPNGKQLRGRPIPWRKGVELIQLYDDYMAGAPAGTSVVLFLRRWVEASGVDEAALEDLTLGEVVDAANRFFYHRRPAPTRSAAAPRATSAPTGPELAPPPSPLAGT